MSERACHPECEADHESNFKLAMARYHQLVSDLGTEIGCKLEASDMLLQAAVGHAASHLHGPRARAGLHRVVDDFFDQANALRAKQDSAVIEALARDRADA